MKDMLKMEKKGDAQSLAPYVQSLVLPQSRAWFESVFVHQVGDSLADSYERTAMELPLAFPDMLGQLRAKHFAQPRAVRFDDSCDPNATDTEYDVLTWRTSSQPLYVVRLSNETATATLRYFAYVDGAFRYTGNFQASITKPVAPTPGSPRIRVGGTVMFARIIHQAVPVYPEAARAAGISGTVVLHAVIGKNGKVCRLQVVSGPPILVPAAIDAVRQWRYTPYLLNGQPVEVDTTVQAIFNMR